MPMWSRLGNHGTHSLRPYGWTSDPSRVSQSPSPLFYAWMLNKRSSFFHLSLLWEAYCSYMAGFITPRPQPAPTSDGESLFSVWPPHSKAAELKGKPSLWHGVGLWSELHPWPPKLVQPINYHLARASENRQIQVALKVRFLCLFGNSADSWLWRSE